MTLTPVGLFTSLIGYRVAGIAGSLVALLGLCVDRKSVV